MYSQIRAQKYSFFVTFQPLLLYNMRFVLNFFICIFVVLIKPRIPLINHTLNQRICLIFIALPVLTVRIFQICIISIYKLFHLKSVGHGEDWNMN